MKTVSMLSQARTTLVHFTKQLFSILALLVFLFSFVTTPAFATSTDKDCSSISDPNQQMVCLYDKNGDGKVADAELDVFKTAKKSVGIMRSASATNDVCGGRERLSDYLESCEDFGGRCSYRDGCPGCKAGVTLYCATNQDTCCMEG